MVTDLSGKVISEDEGAGFRFTGAANAVITCRKKMTEQDHFYGLGEKTGYLDKKGRRYCMWNTDDFTHTPTKDPLYKTIPFFIVFDGAGAYGIFVDKTCRTWFDLGDESSSYYSFEAEDSEMDYYFINGPELKKVIGTYTELTGRIYLPPIWALGYQQCRWSYFPEETVRKLAKDFRAKDIPCDVIYLDIDYMEGYRVFTWDRERFPDPERMLEDLGEKGFKIVTIVDPGVKKDSEYDVYMEGIRDGLFCKWPTGEVYHGKVWPGDAAFPDFTREAARKWWGDKHRELLGKGIAGIWNDMNEPSDFTPDNPDRTKMTVPDGVMLENDGHPRSKAKYHNAYGFNMCRGTLEGFKQHKPGERPFILTRSAYAGIQRYAAVWTGDNHSWWEHMAASMPMHLNIGLSGVPFVGADVGGFSDNASPELFARWMQLGVFTPFFRAHSCAGTKPHEPWAFCAETEEICRKYIKLRYTLLPFIYNEFHKASRTGLPVMRPLVLEYPGDRNTHNMCDEFLFGENVLVAPVYRPSTCKRCVYLPEGTWYSWWDNEVYAGGSYIIADAPLDVLPIFVRDGSCIPTGPVMNYVGEKQADVLTLNIYPGKGFGDELYEDDGISEAYRQGAFRLTEIHVERSETSLRIVLDPVEKGYRPAPRKFELKVHGMIRKPAEIKCDDLISYKFEAEKKVCQILVKDTGSKQQLELLGIE